MLSLAVVCTDRLKTKYVDTVLAWLAQMHVKVLFSQSQGQYVSVIMYTTR